MKLFCVVSTCQTHNALQSRSLYGPLCGQFKIDRL